MTSEQLTGNNPPYLCNVALPANITDIDPKRDCDRLPQFLIERYNWTKEEAEQEVQTIRGYQWDAEPTP